MLFDQSLCLSLVTYCGKSLMCLMNAVVLRIYTVLSYCCIRLYEKNYLSLSSLGLVESKIKVLI